MGGPYPTAGSAYVPIWAGCRWKDVSAARGLREVFEAIRRRLPSPAGQESVPVGQL